MFAVIQYETYTYNKHVQGLSYIRRFLHYYGMCIVMIFPYTVSLSYRSSNCQAFYGTNNRLDYITLKDGLLGVECCLIYATYVSASSYCRLRLQIPSVPWARDLTSQMCQFEVCIYKRSGCGCV